MEAQIPGKATRQMLSRFEHGVMSDTWGFCEKSLCQSHRSVLKGRKAVKPGVAVGDKEWRPGQERLAVRWVPDWETRLFQGQESLAGLLEQLLCSGQSCTFHLAPLGVWCCPVIGVGEVVPAWAELVNLKGEFLCWMSARQPASSSDSAGVAAVDVGHQQLSE